MGTKKIPDVTPTLEEAAPHDEGEATMLYQNTPETGKNQDQSGGAGEAACRGSHSAGATVIVHGRSETGLQSAARSQTLRTLQKIDDVEAVLENQRGPAV